MASVTIYSDFGAKENSLPLFPLFPHLFAMKWWDQMPWSSFSECWFLSQLFPLSSFTFIKRLFSSSSISAIRVVSSAYWGCWYFSLQSWLQLVLHPAQHFSWCTLHISLIIRVTIYSLDVLLSHLKPVYCSISSSNCCFLTWIQVSHEAGQVVLCFFLFKNFQVCCIPHSHRLWHSQ